MVAVGSRRAAAFALARWLLTKDFAPSLLPDGPDRAFVQDLVFTAIRRLRTLRFVLGQLVSRWPKGELEALLYIGAAQVLYMDDVPDFAAVNETVEAAKACEQKSVARVVNGVLRNLLRRREELAALVAAAPLEVRESFPTELVRRWTARWGVEAAERLCRWHNEPPSVFLARRDGTFAPLAHGRRVEAEPGYTEGEFIVQDPATRHAVELMDVQPGERVLDLCAAPGGKTAQLAWRGARVVACEVNPSRRRKLEENAARLRLDVEVVPEPPPASAGLFGKILVDAPCSNTGVLRRRPDARWNWSEKRLAALVKLQAEILDAAAARLAPGGTIVYSTCSNEPEENSCQAAAFLARHPDFTLVREVESVPFESGEDGAYAAALVML